MKITEILLETADPYKKTFPQSNDVGGGNIVISGTTDQFNDVDSFSFEYVNGLGQTKVKYDYEQGNIMCYPRRSLEDVTLDNLRDNFVRQTGEIMKNNYENMAKSLDDTEDRTMKHIKQVKYESKNNIMESTIESGLKPAIEYMDKIIASAKRYEARKNSGTSNLDEASSEEAIEKVESLFKDR